MSDQDLFSQGEEPVRPAEDPPDGQGDNGKDSTPVSRQSARQAIVEGKLQGPLSRLMDDNFLQYASYVIRDRAIPDLDDGLKPVQRRIMYSLFENDDGKFIKVANIAGYCMQYHPHGNVSIEDALVSIVNKRYLIEGQGNFGNLYTGDPAAASRYIECRLTELARTQLFNDKLTPFVPSYDGRRKEPVVLPAKLPLLLMLGAEGIAVGLSTRILPHNFKELLEAQIAILQKKKFALLPDFQQGGVMDDTEYNKGNGRIKVRAVLEPKKDGRILVTEIPFGTTTDSLIGSIEEAVRKKKLKIRSINDFTSEKVEIEIKLAPGENIETTMERLYAFTQCEVSISSRVVVIHKNRPVEMDVDQVLKHNTARLVKILEKELRLERQRLLDELHFKTLIQIFIENRIYKEIEECKTYPEVQQSVLDGVNAFRSQLRRDVTRQDVETLLAIQIKRISRFDINKNRKEIGDILAGLDEVERYLGEVVAYAIRYLRALLKKYGNLYPRMTRTSSFEKVELKQLTATEYAVQYDREKGYLGHGVSGEEPLFECSSYDRVIVVWSDGRYKVMPPPEKLFVDSDVIYCAVHRKDQVFTLIYVYHEITYIKCFTFGGAIMNRDYTCAPPTSKVLLLEEGQADSLYVAYEKAKNQKIHQQEFHPRKTPVKGVKSRGAQITVKKIKSITSQCPRNWSRRKGSRNPRAVPLDF